MTTEQILAVLAIKPKLENYYASKTLRLTPAEIGTLQSVAQSIGIPRTDWWCATCAIGRLAELIAHAEHCQKENDLVFNVNGSNATDES